jgi:hypothetical protein
LLTPICRREGFEPGAAVQQQSRALTT